MSFGDFDVPENNTQIFRDIRSNLQNMANDTADIRRSLDTTREKVEKVQEEISSFRNVVHRDMGVSFAWAWIIMNAVLMLILWRVW